MLRNQSDNTIITEKTSLTYNESPESHLDDTKRQQLINNLIALNVNEECIESIINNVEDMPGEDHVKGALNFLTQLRDPRCQRENYYTWSPYVAEFFCTISNAGFFAVGAYDVNFAALIAGTFSALSHAFPTQRFQQSDYLGVLGVFIYVATQYKTIAAQPISIAWGGGALALAIIDNAPPIMDRILPGCKKNCNEQHPWFQDYFTPNLHVAWHLAAAVALFMFDIYVNEVSRRIPSEPERIVTFIWGSIGLSLCVIAFGDGLMRRLITGCKNTFFNNENQNNEHASVEEIRNDMTTIIIKK